jgi:hypothetical protein
MSKKKKKRCLEESCVEMEMKTQEKNIIEGRKK